MTCEKVYIFLAVYYYMVMKSKANQEISIIFYRRIIRCL